MDDIRNRITEIRKMKLGDIAHNPHNWREHPDNQRASFRGIVSEVGWAGMPLVYHSERVGGLTYVDGHMRKEELPDFEADVAITDLNDEEADLLLATYDPISAAAEANREKLGALLQNVQSGEAGVQALLAGLAEREGVFFGGNGKPPEDPGPQIDRAGELLEKWQVEHGQVWEIGHHCLVCGDSLEDEMLGAATSGNKIDLVLTDPPYGISIVAGLRATVGGSKPVTIGAIRGRRPYPFGGVKNMRGTVGAAQMVDATLYRPVEGDDRPFDPRPLLDLAENAIIFGGNYFSSKLPDSRCWIVWDKNNTGNFADAELAWTSFDKGVTLYQFTWNGLVREGKREIEGVKRFHPTQKPVGLFVKILEDFTEDRAIVLDPYLGSGATLLACELSGRSGVGIEIDPAYCSVTLERLAGMGLEPRRVDKV